MRLKNKERKEFTADTDLVLTSIDGAPFLTFPMRVIHPIRRLISRLDRKGDLPPRLSFTAALRREGVSYISWAFATTLAFDLETSVCVVDLNWWWPSDMYLNEQPSGGLGALLAGDAQLGEVVIPTGLPNLAFLPSGMLPADERPYFARSALLKEIISELNARYDHLVLDIPAVLASNDAIPLASLSTAFCLVIHQGVTSIDEVKSTLDDLDHLRCLGAVMNKYRFDMPKFLQKFANPQSA